jgi:hypothetical protein
MDDTAAQDPKRTTPIREATPRGDARKCPRPRRQPGYSWLDEEILDLLFFC